MSIPRIGVISKEEILSYLIGYSSRVQIFSDPNFGKVEMVTVITDKHDPPDVDFHCTKKNGEEAMFDSIVDALEFVLYPTNGSFSKDSRPSRRR